ncbi:SufD family Fe-S cluster assembly protein [Candidatus Micrarchaeota archaeon]|nr:SufD family Fe-S cluster assembly protein [Candidatus Micrarchaeota archaeon]
MNKQLEKIDELVRLNNEPSWLEKLRKNALKKWVDNEYYVEADSPTQKKYTNFSLDLTNNSSPAVKFESSGNAIVLDFKTALQQEESLVKKHFQKLLNPEISRNAALHFALFNTGCLIIVPEDVEASVKTSFTGESVLAHSIVITGKNAKLDYFEDFSSTNASTSFSEVFIGENSKTDYNFLENASITSQNYSLKKSVLSEKASFQWIAASFGSSSTIQEFNSSLEGRNANSDTYLLFFGKNKQESDLSTNIRHAVPDTTGNLLAKGILDDEANSVHRGMILIENPAKNTFSHLMGRALLLSNKAKANSLPALEIKTNDVKSRHGASVSHIDKDSVFYLQSRGLKKRDAELLIIEGFAQEIIDKSQNPAWRSECEKLLKVRMQ